MTNQNYGLSDGDGNQLTIGLQAHNARKIAQERANELGRSVWLWESPASEGSGDGERFDPEIPTTKTPVTIDGWYEHTDGTYGYYTGAARAGGPVMVRSVVTADECVDRAPDGTLVSVGWPARSAYGVHDDHGNWTQTRNA
jgi:hypothetical protein